MSIRCQVLEYSRAPVIGGVIKGVKIIGTRSSNGRVYPQPVLRAAIPLYEAAAVYIYHPSDPEKRRGSRQLVDHLGSLSNVHERFDGQIGLGLWGDLHVKQSHPMAQLIVESDGHQFGLSHNAVVEMNDDQTEVTGIVEVNSVDLVDDPATTMNLFEEIEPMGLEEFQKSLDEMKESIDAGAKALGDRIAVLEAAKPEEKPKPEPKPKRIAALEHVTEGEGALATGNTHEDFMGALRGFPVTNA